MTDLTLSTHEIGEGVPVVIIHGWEWSGKVEELDFEPIFSKAPGFHRFYLNLPGMGGAPANSVKNLDDMYLRLTQFIDARFGKSRFLLLGTSCGGYLAHALAQRYVEQVDGVLLRVPLIEPQNSLRDLDPFQPLVVNEELISTMHSEDKTLLGNIYIQTSAYIKSLKAKYENAYNSAAKGVDKEVIDAIRSDQHRYQLSPSSVNTQTKVPAPTLIICGRHDPVVGYRDSLRLLELYPRSTYAVLDRGTHNLPVDENDLFEALVRNWLARVEEWQTYR